ncbi:MAG TPA: metallophosphoesterase [Ignavibacteria bacterium]
MKKLFVITIYFLFFLTGVVRSDIILKPYLQAVTQNSIYVLIECDSKDKATVYYGNFSNIYNEASTEFISITDKSPETYVHKIKISGLNPETKYFYKVRQGNTESVPEEFTTAVLPGTPFRFAWMADCRNDTTVHGQIATLIKNADPKFSLYGGDLCSKPGYKYWKSEFFIYSELELISKVPFFNTPGNHEGWEQNTKAFTHAPESASGLQDYYSFDYGDLHVLVLNNEVDCFQGSPQYVFAEKDLSATKQIWKIVIFHEPAYCFGGHGENTEMKKISKKVFVPNKVDLTITGHSHFYQHNFVENIHHLVIGSAGAGLYNPGNTSWTVKSVKDYNFAIVDVSSEKLDLKVYNNYNNLLDSLLLVKE